MPVSHWSCTVWATVKYWIVALTTYDVENFMCLKRQRLYLYFRNNLKPRELQEPLSRFSLSLQWKAWTRASCASPVPLWKVEVLQRRQLSVIPSWYCMGDIVTKAPRRHRGICTRDHSIYLKFDLGFFWTNHEVLIVLQLSPTSHSF